MESFSPEYRAAIEKSLRAFVNNGDDVACVAYYWLASSYCRMCGHEEIKNHYVLENLRTHKHLIVGSRCIGNYPVILAEWGYTPDRIVFPHILRAEAQLILGEHPSAIIFDDVIVMRFQSNCNAIITANWRADDTDNEIWKYHYATIESDGDTRRIVGVHYQSRGIRPLGDFSNLVHPRDRGEGVCEECGGMLACCPECDDEICAACGDSCSCDYNDDDDYDDEDNY